MANVGSGGGSSEGCKLGTGIMNALACRSRREDSLVYNADVVPGGFEITRSSESPAAFPLAELIRAQEAEAVPRTHPDDSHHWLQVYTIDFSHVSNSFVRYFRCGTHSTCTAILCMVETDLEPNTTTTTTTGTKGGPERPRRRRRRKRFHPHSGRKPPASSASATSKASPCFSQLQCNVM